MNRAGERIRISQLVILRQQIHIVHHDVVAADLLRFVPADVDERSTIETIRVDLIHNEKYDAQSTVY